MTGRGIGGALYERLRAEARSLGVIGIFMECLPDDPALCRDPKILAQNKARLKFYEQYGARPVAHTAYDRITSYNVCYTKLLRAHRVPAASCAPTRLRERNNFV